MRLAEARRQAGLSREQLDDAAQVVRGTVGAIEDGVARIVSLRTARALARVLGKRMEEIDELRESLGLDPV